MAIFQVTRNDVYVIDFEAEDMNDALDKIERDDGLLNSGSYAGSEFGEIEQTQP